MSEEELGYHCWIVKLVTTVLQTIEKNKLVQHKEDYKWKQFIENIYNPAVTKGDCYTKKYDRYI